MKGEGPLEEQTFVCLSLKLILGCCFASQRASWLELLGEQRSTCHSLIALSGAGKKPHCFQWHNSYGCEIKALLVKA